MANRRDDVRALAASLSVSLGACGGSLNGQRSSAPDSGLPAVATSDAGAGDSPALPPLDVRLDPSFAMQGRLGGDLARWTPNGVAIDTEGRVVVSGPGQQPDAPVQEVVRRFTGDGVLDDTFGASGAATFAVDSYEWGQADRTLSTGSIGIMGAAPLDGGPGAFAIRLAGDGSVDTDFAASPVLASSVGSFSTGLWEDDGSGFFLGDRGVVRFGADGVVDPSYGAGQLAAPAAAGALAPDGRLWTASGDRVSRYLASGAPDPGFGQAGSVEVPPVAADAPAITIQTLLLELDGAAVVVASHPYASSYDVDVLRVDAAGAVDRAYAGSGTVSVPANGAPTGAAKLADGRLIVWTSYGDLVAIEPSGAPEGTSPLDVLGTVLAATLDPSQRLVVVGMETTDPQNNKWFVRRYLLL